MPIEVETRDLAGIPFRLGEYLVEPSLNRLSRGDSTTQLELKVMDVLVCLAERVGEVVTRQEIVDRVWATEFISDNTLTHAITELRNALGDDARNPSFIETIHRRGYRLIATIEPSVSDEVGDAKVARFPVPERPSRFEGDRSPYPGLAAFTEADAEFFFGREDEVAKMWRKLTSRRLLAVIGPSGVGKSSFLRAGVIPARPEGWGVIICQPGEAPFPALARALVPIFAGDIEATTQLVDISDGDRAVAVVSRWRDRHKQAVLIVDQFEELFTLNPPETQERFATTLRRLVDDADVHVLLSLRDDFLHRCHEKPSLVPVFEDLTPIGQPGTEALVRALIEPARRLGFEFEDADLPKEMASEVEGERSALPLLAFAVARLWDERETESRTMTRSAYDEIGGVGGALGKHAEATLKAIGDDRMPIVRELFRNLVTAEGTRAVREWDELLSVFDEHDRGVAEGVLLRLVDARLLTSFEEEAVEGDGRRRVEVVHESLLSSWPRLVRWQSQDADAAQLRDQLRQAARTWDEHDRTDDLLWTGSAFREYEMWRERYPGGLTDVEENFGAAMSRSAKRRARRRRIAATAVLALAMVLAVVFGTLWRRSVQETRRAEASKLLALAEVQLDTDPTEALAYTISSLELADTFEARSFALRALWEGPPLRALDLRQASDAEFQANTFSPDGRWLAVAGLVSEDVLVYGEAGGKPIILGGHKVSASGEIQCGWTRDGLLVTGHWTEGRARVWSIPEGRMIREIDLGGDAFWVVGDTHLLARIVETEAVTGKKLFRLRSWRLPDGQPQELGEVHQRGAFDRNGKSWIYTEDESIYSRPLPVNAGVTDTMIARHSSGGAEVHHWGRPQGLFSSDGGGEVVLWTATEGTSVPGRRLRKPETAVTRLKPDPSGRWAVNQLSFSAGNAHLWDLAGLVGANPRLLRRNGEWILSDIDFHPDLNWVIATTKNRREVSFWPLSVPNPFVVDATDGWKVFEFTPDGRHILTSDYGSGQRSGARQVRLWPLPGDESAIVDLKFPPHAQSGFRTVTIDPSGERVLSTGYGHHIFLLSVTGKEPRQLEGFPATELVHGGAFSPSGRQIAAASMTADDQATLRVWDLETGEVRVFDQPKDPEAYAGYFARDIAFMDETTIYTSGANGLLRWDLETGSYEQILRSPPGGGKGMRMTSDRQKMFTWEEGGPEPRRVETDIYDLRTGAVRSLASTRGTWTFALSRDGTIRASGMREGRIRVGRTDESEPHLLLGHEGAVDGIAISPDLRWIASSGQDKTLRLWPMPDLSKPPLHTLPHDELIARLKTLTNLRVVRDEKSATGWKLEVGPFPGWAEVPEW